MAGQADRLSGWRSGWNVGCWLLGWQSGRLVVLAVCWFVEVFIPYVAVCCGKHVISCCLTFYVIKRLETTQRLKRTQIQSFSLLNIWTFAIVARSFKVRDILFYSLFFLCFILFLFYFILFSFASLWWWWSIHNYFAFHAKSWKLKQQLYALYIWESLSLAIKYKSSNNNNNNYQHYNNNRK